MLSKSQEKLIRSLNTKKGRQESGLCLVEGEKALKAAGRAVQFIFTRKDTKEFDSLVTTETPQDSAGVAKIPHYDAKDILECKTIVVLDGVQDPGNVGAIMRLCLGFNASLILIESADPSSPKVIRSSAGSIFDVPWVEMKRDSAEAWIKKSALPVFRLETPKPNSSSLFPFHTSTPPPSILIAGSEGRGITLKTKGKPISIPHNASLESLNVTHALAIVLFERFSSYYIDIS